MFVSAVSLCDFSATIMPISSQCEHFPNKSETETTWKVFSTVSSEAVVRLNARVITLCKKVCQLLPVVMSSVYMSQLHRELLFSLTYMNFQSVQWNS